LIDQEEIDAHNETTGKVKKSEDAERRNVKDRRGWGGAAVNEFIGEDEEL